jgi:hypothetical protein
MTSLLTRFSTFTATVTVPVFAPELVPRAPQPTIDPRQTTVIPSSIPSYASACSGSVRYSSACSCIGVTGVTTTAPAPSTTVTATATATTTEVANCPAFTAATSPFLIVYSVYYSGSGFTENTTNPGNDLPNNYPPLTTTYPGTMDPCTAIQTCTQDSYADPDAYYSFDLHYLASTEEWECVSYFDPNISPSYFNVPNPDILIAYGYSLPPS